MNKNNSKNSLIIILHEIYGVNDHIKSFRDVLIKEGFNVLIPNLLHREFFSYDKEEEAYAYFTNEVGFTKSLGEVIRIIDTNRAKFEQIFIVGFSIGATIAWTCSEFEVEGIIGFYGSRIRDYVEIEPRCPTLLFFPVYEKSFNVLELEYKINNKKNVTVEIIEAEHGFMNPYYKNYNLKENIECINKSIGFFKRIEEGTGIR